MTAQSNKPETEHFLKEWEMARSVLNNFDQRLHDLRKIGFTVITTLLAADAIIIKDFFISDFELDQSVKFAVLFLTFGLILTLSILDRNYRVYQEAAATRAKVIERKINLELTEVIAQRYNVTKLQYFTTGLYMALTILVFIMGFTVLSVKFKLWLLVTCIVANASIYVVNYTPRALFKLEYPFGKLDWTLDPLQCTKNEQVEITVNNLGKKPIPFPKNTIMWRILKEEDGSEVDSGGADNRDISIGKEDSFTWLWTPKCEGVYRVHRLTLDKETNKWSKFEPLKRKFIVRN